jgi:hypothetical protein
VVWTYRVANTGNSALKSITIADTSGRFAPKYVSGDTNTNGLLDPGETWLYTSAGVSGAAYSVVGGQYLSAATVTGTDAHLGSTVTASDASDHFGALNQIAVHKAVNAVDPWHPTAFEDANYAPGPILLAGSTVTWTYLITNSGTTSLDLTGVQDDLGTGNPDSGIPVTAVPGFYGDTNGNGMLDPGETWLFSATGTVVPGQYKNTVTATATVLGEPTPTEKTATDVAYLFGTNPGIQVVKQAKAAGASGNGQADRTPGSPLLFASGSTLTYTYFVTATTATPLGSITIVDDNGTPAATADDLTPVYVSGDANSNGTLDPGETWVYTASSPLPYGFSGNVVRVSGQAGGGTVWANDINYHVGVLPAVKIVKAVDALDPLHPTPIEDANTQPAKELPVGTTAVWTYLVTNTGDAPVKITSLVDNNGTAASTTDDFAPVYVSGDTNGNGLLDLGETWLYRATTIVQAGAYMNTAVVIALQPTTLQTATGSDVAGYFGNTGSGEGFSPGFWKNHSGWPTFLPDQLLSSVFGPVPAYDATETLLDALNNGGGGVEALFRHAVAALLNATSPTISFPWTSTQVVTNVNAALASGNPTTIDNLAAQLDRWDNLEGNMDPPSITPTASINSVSVTEGNAGQTTNAVFTITLSFGPVAPASIAWATADGTATVALGDYTAKSGTISFAVGQTTATISVPVIGNNVYEPNETFSVSLSNPQGLNVATGTGTGTIVNDDATAVLTVAATQAIAVESPSQAGVYTITRSANATGAIAVNLTWSGTAAASRYTLTATGGTLNAAGTQLTVPDGGSAATVTLTPKADGIAEPAQTALLTLGGSTQYSVGSPSAATVTLYDTTAPTVSISPVTVTKAGSTSNQTVSFTISLSGSSPNPVSVAVKTVDGTAVAGTSYTAVSTTLTFAAGTITGQSVSVTLLGRASGTVNKNFTVVLSSPTGATLGTSTSTVTITGTSAQLAAGVAPAGSVATPLTQGQLQPVIAAAERQWAAAGVAPSRLAAIKFVITTLPLGEVGYTVGNTVYIDATAAGFGWYTGATGGFGANGLALAGGPAAGRIDLLTVVLHEIGHTVGLPDGCACGPFTTLMQTSLPAGVRRLLPAGARLHSAVHPIAALRAGRSRSRAAPRGRGLHKRARHLARPGLFTRS